jgi:hypothetical protein
MSKTKVTPVGKPKNARGQLSKLSKIKIQGNKQVPIVLRAIFSNYDTDASGSISKKEMAALVMDLQSMLPGTPAHLKHCSNVVSKIAMAALDIDGGGTIDEDEFVEWSQSNLFLTAEDRATMLVGNMDLSQFITALEMCVKMQVSLVLIIFFLLLFYNNFFIINKFFLSFLSFLFFLFFLLFLFRLLVYYFFFFRSAFLLFCFLQLAGIGPYNYYTPPPPTCREKWCTKKLLIIWCCCCVFITMLTMGLVFIFVLVPNECQFGTQKLCPAKAKSRTKKKSSQTDVSTPAPGGETAGTTTDAAAPSADRRFRRLDFVASIPKVNHWNSFDNKVNEIDWIQAKENLYALFKGYFR